MTKNVEDSTRSSSCLGKLTMLPFLIVGMFVRAAFRRINGH